MEHDENEGTGNVNEGASLKATTPPAYFRDPWADVPSRGDVRSAYVRATGSRSFWEGSVTHHRSEATLRSFGEDRGAFLSARRRSNCEAWRRLADDFADACREVLRAEFDLSAEPMAIMYAGRGRGDFHTVELLWKLQAGGITAQKLHRVSACGQCPDCKASAVVAPVESWVYFIQAATGGPVKIGYSAKPYARLATLRSGSAGDLRIVAFTPGGVEEERMLHRLFARHRIRPRGEWFHPAPAILALIAELAEVTPP